jgi:hypothetical protein
MVRALQAFVTLDQLAFYTWRTPCVDLLQAFTDDSAA